MNMQSTPIDAQKLISGSQSEDAECLEIDCTEIAFRERNRQVFQRLNVTASVRQTECRLDFEPACVGGAHEWRWLKLRRAVSLADRCLFLRVEILEPV